VADERPQKKETHYLGELSPSVKKIGGTLSISHNLKIYRSPGKGVKKGKTDTIGRKKRFFVSRHGNVTKNFKKCGGREGRYVVGGRDRGGTDLKRKKELVPGKESRGAAGKEKWGG